MRLEPLAVAGAYALTITPARDERGWFSRLWDAHELAAAGLVGTYVQQSVAYNEVAGTVRGMHVAFAPAQEAKIVRCLRGAIVDVVVDARPASSTFGSHVALQLDDAEHQGLYVPPGCAHGYQTLRDGTEVLYDISEAYRPDLATGIRHDDPALRIVWPLPVAAISARDASLPTLAEYRAALSQGTRS